MDLTQNPSRSRRWSAVATRMSTGVAAYGCARQLDAHGTAGPLGPTAVANRLGVFRSGGESPPSAGLAGRVRQMSDQPRHYGVL